MGTPSDDDRLTAWWLDLAPSRQEEALADPSPPPVWFTNSVAEAGLDPALVEAFLRAKRDELDPTRDAGLNPKPDSSSPI